MSENFKLSCLASISAQILLVIDNILQYSDEMQQVSYRKIRETRCTIDEIRNDARDLSQRAPGEYEPTPEVYLDLLEKLNLTVRTLCDSINVVLQDSNVTHYQEIHSQVSTINDLIRDIYDYEWQDLQ